MSILSGLGATQLLSCFDRDKAAYKDFSGRVIKGIAVWEFPNLIGSPKIEAINPWLKRVGHTSAYPSLNNEYETVLSELVVDENTGKLKCRDMTTLRFREVCWSDAEVVDVDEYQFMSDLAALVGMSSSLCEVECCLESVVWSLGSTFIQDEGYLPVYVVRGYERHRYQIREVIEKRSLAAMVLSTSPDIPRAEEWSRHFHFRRVSDLIQAERG